MSELMRWRLTRAPQRKVPKVGSTVPLENPTSEAIGGLNSHIAAGIPGAITSGSLTIPPAFMFPELFSTYIESISPAGRALLEVDAWLVQKQNRPLPADLSAKIQSVLGGFLPNSADWKTLRSTLTHDLYLYLILQAANDNHMDLNVGEQLVRPLSIMALVDSLQLDPNLISTADDAYDLLRWRTLTLPANITGLLTAHRLQHRPALVRRPAFSDLYVTREEWNRYGAAEIASIENILGGELKSRVHVLVNQTQQTTTIDQQTTQITEQDTSLTVPTGYYAETWTATVMADVLGDISDTSKFLRPYCVVNLAVGGGAMETLTGVNGGPNPDPSIHYGKTGTDGPITQGVVPIAMQADTVNGFEINIVVPCRVSDDLYAKWQLDTYDRIVGAYNALLQRYNDERAGLAVDQTNPVDTSSPSQNRQTIQQELKRQVIEMLTGKPFSGRSAVQWDPTGVNPPITQLDNARRVAAEIQFLEQAFEWEIMSYIYFDKLVSLYREPFAQTEDPRAEPVDD